MPKFTGGQRLDSRAQFCGCVLDATQVVAGKFENGDSSSGQVLLIADILIRGDEQIELGLRLLDQVSVLETAPTLALGGGALVPGKELVERPRDTLVQEHPNAAEANTACCESSSNLVAASRDTEGKHSRNSSSE
jgi:hypothetical protein